MDNISSFYEDAKHLNDLAAKCQMGPNNTYDKECIIAKGFKCDNRVIHYSDLEDICSHMELWAFRCFYPILLLISIVANVLNLLIYRLPYFKGATALHLLRMKAITNIGSIVLLLFDVIHYWLPANFPPAKIEEAYWLSKPYLLALVNICGTSSAWFTLIISVETVVCVEMPVQFRNLNKSKYSHFVIAICLSLAVILQSAIPIVWYKEGFRHNKVIESGHCWSPISFGMSLRPGAFFKIYERVYFWVQSIAVIILPIGSMLICSFILAANFQENGLGPAFSSRRKCVIRITFATALAHLILEGPSLITFILGAIYGSNPRAHKAAVKTCLIPVITNFLASINAAIPFFVYCLCSNQFRRMARMVLAPIFGHPPSEYDELNRGDGAISRTRLYSTDPWTSSRKRSPALKSDRILEENDDPEEGVSLAMVPRLARVSFERDETYQVFAENVCQLQEGDDLL